MKKPVKRIIISICIVAGLLVVLSASYLVKFYFEGRKMTPLATMKVLDDVYSIRDKYVNFYLIKREDSFIAIDAGIDGGSIALEMKKLDIDPLKVTHVFLTHTDSDHTGYVTRFNNARIYISRDEEQMLNGDRHRIFFFDNKLERRYEMLNDNETVRIPGLKVEAVLTPGHTPGSMSYRVNDRYIFTGDTVSLKNGKAGLFNDFFNMDSRTEALSLKKLASLASVKFIFTAHYGYSGDYKKAFQDWK